MIHFLSLASALAFYTSQTLTEEEEEGGGGGGGEEELYKLCSTD
jgi:hypothetical protein